MSRLEEYQTLYLRLTNHNSTGCDVDSEEDDQRKTKTYVGCGGRALLIFMH